MGCASVKGVVDDDPARSLHRVLGVRHLDLSVARIASRGVAMGAAFALYGTICPAWAGSVWDSNLVQIRTNSYN